MQGQGEYFWPGNTRYKGNFKHGKKHGRGIYTCTDGKICEAEWNMGEINGKGLVTLPGNKQVLWEWQNNIPFSFEDMLRAQEITFNSGMPR